MPNLKADREEPLLWGEQKSAVSLVGKLWTFQLAVNAQEKLNWH